MGEDGNRSRSNGSGVFDFLDEQACSELLPEQLRPRANLFYTLYGERRLLYALLRDAYTNVERGIQDMLTYGGIGVKESAHGIEGTTVPFEQDIDWFRDRTYRRDAMGGVSFESACDGLDLDAGLIRKHLLSKFDFALSVVGELTVVVLDKEEALSRGQRRRHVHQPTNWKKQLGGLHKKQ